MDNISVKRIATLIPKLRSEGSSILIDCEKAGVPIRITSAWRGDVEQNNLFAIGRTLPGRVVTNAKAWQSYHQYGLAVDICLLHKDGSISYSLTEDLDGDKLSDWMEVVGIFKKYGWEWAGEWSVFKETPHFQKTFGYKEAQLEKIVRVDKNLIENKYPNI